MDQRYLNVKLAWCLRGPRGCVVNPRGCAWSACVVCLRGCVAAWYACVVGCVVEANLHIRNGDQ